MHVTTIYMKTECFRRGIVVGKESALGAWRVALIKSLIYTRKKRHAGGAGLSNSAESLSWYLWSVRWIYLKSLPRLRES